jgi:hypothetical protein
MAPRNLSDLFRALVTLVRTEIAEWKRAIGWGRVFIVMLYAPLADGDDVGVKQPADKTV